MLSLFANIIGAANFVSSPGYPTKHQNDRVRLSKSGAVLVGFFIFHSIPNILLTRESGRARYSKYGIYHSTSSLTKVIELFLLTAGITHGILATKKAYARLRNVGEPHPHGRTFEMMFTGTIISVFLVIHLFDFRFNEKEDEKHLDVQVLDSLDRRHNRLRNAIYWMFVISVGVHAWRGTTKAWFFRLGFRDKKETFALHRLCKCLILVGTVLYGIPLVLKNPYNQEPGSPVRGRRIISVD
jgi:succinate dehydrogenase hydrophobic anchor subunit